jgi:putative ABC transport system permease protein
MNVIALTYQDILMAAVLVFILAGITYVMKLGLARQLGIAAVRTTVQLLLIGLVLKSLFAHAHLIWVSGIAILMVLAAGREVIARQKWRFKGFWGFGVGTGSMFISSFAIAVLALRVMIGPTPWYTPQYAIPLLGMLLGNTMNGIALAMKSLTQSAFQQRALIEQRLMLGDSSQDSISDIRRDSMRTGMIPIINAMAAAGIVSLPGMMTGQILAGSPPTEAVMYQILIMLLITAGTGFGTAAAILMTARRLFDDRHRLRLDRLRATKE